MSPIEPSEGYVENYFLLIGDKNLNNFTRLLELKGVRKPEQNVLIDMFYKRLSQHDDLSDNSKLLPSESLVTSNPISSSSVATIPSSITTSLTTMASTAASNFNINNTNGTHHVLSPTTSSPTEGTRGRLNENFRKLMMTGMAFRKDLQERREHT